MSKFVYADNAATTKLSDTAFEAMKPYLTELYGNPSSLYRLGIKTRAAVDNAREDIAKLLNASKPNEIYFVSGGSEADNWAIKGAAELGEKKGKKHIISSKFEHHAVLHTLEYLEKKGFEITLLDVHEDGLVRPEELEAAIRSDTALVTIMFANNEIGTIQPIKELAETAHKHGVIFHTDAVQAVGTIPVDIAELGVDMLSLSAHKFHGPKGVGALYIKKGVHILPIHFGGLQEKKIRPGTEPCPAICAMGAAIEELNKNKNRLQHIEEINLYCRKRLSETEGIVINSDNDCIPYIINFSAEGLRSETVLHFLAERHIYVSSGSACAKGQKSHVLKSLGLPDKIADSAIRVSFSEENNREDIDILIKSLEEALLTLARSKKM